MGAEQSTEGGGQGAADPFNPYANVVVRPRVVSSSGEAPTSPGALMSPGTPSPNGTASRPGTSSSFMRPTSSSKARLSDPADAGGPHVSAAKQRLLDRAADNKVWLQSKQTRVSTPVDVRRRYPSASGARPVRPPPTLESQMGQLLKSEEEPAQATLEQVLEEKKAEFIGKLSNFIGKGSNVKLPADLAMPKIAVAPPKQKPIPAHVRASWMDKLLASKEEIMENIREKLASGQAYEPMTQDEVGEEVEKSLGDTFEQFSSYQGTINNMMESGLDETFLDQFFMDEESEKQLTTYEKWAVIRHAAEQVLQVYANRSNARTIESEQWTTPNVLDVKSGAASVYANTVDSALNQGLVSLLFIDDGRLVETGANTADIAALLSTDLWQAVKELAPHKVPSGQRLERLSVLGRHVLHSAVSLELRYGATAVKSLKVVLAIDSEQEFFVVQELQQWNFFGLHAHNVVILPLPRFHGFAQDVKRNTLVHVLGSPRLLMGTGYAIYLLNSPGEAYVLDPTGTKPFVLSGTVLDWLREMKSNWLVAGLFSDLERLRPDAMLDVDFLAGAIYCADRQGANMAMDVMKCASERELRTYNSIVMGRKEAAGACTLSASSMRTVRAHQLMASASSQGSYTCTGRYAYKITALQRLLANPDNFKADIQLHGFLAYASFDIGEVTTFKDSNCGCVLARGVPGPIMTDVVFTRTWLAYAAGVLEEQDKVDQFRQKAIALIRSDKLNTSGPHIAGLPGAQALRPGGTLEQRLSGGAAQAASTAAKFKERKQGLNVVLVLGMEHKAMARATLKMARLFIRNIVDRLHVVVILGSNENGNAANADLVRALVEEVSDKELEFNGQLSREVITKHSDNVRIQDVVTEVLAAQHAGLVVVPSIKLCGPADLGSTSMSMAFSVAKAVTNMPVLIVKSNTAGRWHSANPANVNPNVAHDFLTVMAHLDSTAVSPMVEAITPLLNPTHDVLFLAKASAYERPGLLSMRSRRVFVQGRMAVNNNLKVQERAYPGQAVPELSKAVEAECVDILVASVTGELPISKEVEELLKAAKTAIYIHRNKDVTTPLTQLQAPLNVEAPTPVGYAYGQKRGGPAS